MVLHMYDDRGGELATSLAAETGSNKKHEL